MVLAWSPPLYNPQWLETEVQTHQKLTVEPLVNNRTEMGFRKYLVTRRVKGFFCFESYILKRISWHLKEIEVASWVRNEF